MSADQSWERDAAGREERFQEAVAFLLSVVACGEELNHHEVLAMRSLIDESKAALASDSEREAETVVVLSREEVQMVLAFLPDPQPHMGWGNVDPLNSARAKLRAALEVSTDG